jgi:predicted ATP-dependent serine protease
VFVVFYVKKNTLKSTIMIDVSCRLNGNSTIYYYIVEKDFKKIRMLSEKLNSEKFICLGVSHNIKDFSKILSEMLIKPSLLFIGFQNITSVVLDQVDYLSKSQSLKIILFNDDISEYNDLNGLNYSVIEV